MTEQKLLSQEASFAGQNDDGGAVFRIEQQITDQFLDECRHIRDEQARLHKCKETHLMFRIPTIFVYEFLREGFDVFEEPPEKIRALLKARGLDHFIISEKS